MEDSARQRVMDRLGVGGLLALPAVAVVIYVTTGDAFSAIIGPGVVGLVIGSMAYAESTDTDVRYIKSVIYAVGIAGGVIMAISPPIPTWFGVGVAVVSAWLLVDTIVDMYERDRDQSPLPHSFEDKQRAEIGWAIADELDNQEYRHQETIADRLDVGEQRIESVLVDMCERGLVERDGERYRLHSDSESFSFGLRRLWSRILRPARIVRHLP